MTDIKKTDGVSAKCHVFDSIRAQILDGRLAYGCRLLEGEVARTYSTSRTPVRRAFLALAHEGLLEHCIGRGWYVTSLRPDDVRDIVSVRAILESHAADMAAAMLSQRQLDCLEQVLADMDSALARDDRVAFADLDRRFHGVICLACPNRRLVGMLETLLKEYPNLVSMTSDEDANKEQREHYRILEALIARQPDRVNKLVSGHFADRLPGPAAADEHAANAGLASGSAVATAQ